MARNDWRIAMIAYAERKVTSRQGKRLLKTHAIKPVAEALERRIVLSGYSINALDFYPASNGNLPLSTPVFDSSGDLYGTTNLGGSSNAGTVFEIVRGSGSIITLASFNGADGLSPIGGVVFDSSGNLYGTTSGGGSDDYGTIFEVVHGSHSITALASFTGGNGKYPQAGVVLDSSGNLYGTTRNGGALDEGVVFELANGSSSITAIASFTLTNGETPEAGVVLDSNGNLYGTTPNGGIANDGTVFEIVKGSSSITTLAPFTGLNGQSPQASVDLDANGDLYGTTYEGGGYSQGTVFEISHGSSSITALAYFNGTNGANPWAGVTFDASGDLYGTTYDGGSESEGTVFEIAHGSSSITALYSFNGSFGDNSRGGVVLDSNGNIYGTTLYDAGGPDGTVFELTQESPYLAFSAAPISTGVGATLGGSAGVQVAEEIPGLDNVNLSDSGAVTLTLHGGVFAGGSDVATAQASNGIASFYNLAINTPGAYTITASNGTAIPVTSGSFNIAAPYTAPTVGTNPLSQTIATGQTVTFSASATGNPAPSVQWQVSTNGGSTWTDIPGATSPTLSFVTAAGQSGYEYHAVFTNSQGSATSAAATLTTIVAPTITTQPVAQTVNAGTRVTFTAAGQGTPAPTYQWQSSGNGGATWTNISGATAASYTFTSAIGQNGMEYRAVLSNSAGTATSNAVVLTVKAAPVIATQPASKTVAAGAKATFTIAATGNPAPTVQWQISTDAGSKWTNIAGATAFSYGFATTLSESSYEYRAILTNGLGTATSSAARLTVTSPPAVTLQPTSQSIAPGKSVTFKAAGSGSPTPSVQWQVSTNGGSTWSNITGATSTSYTLTASTSLNHHKYRAIFTNSAGVATSNAATLTVT